MAAAATPMRAHYTLVALRFLNGIDGQAPDIHTHVTDGHMENPDAA